MGKAKMGRPLAKIDKETFEKLCAMQCTREEVCDFFEISEKTLNSWCMRTYSETFSPVFKKKRSKGKISLRRTQFKLAETNVTMAIWLGKQYLGQSDNPNQQSEEKINKEVDGLSESIKELVKEEKNVKPETD